MDGIVIVLVIIILIILGVILLGNKSNTNAKSSALKKNEIIEQYTNELKSILHKNKDNKEKQLQEKKQYLQKVNSELSRNIFFEAHEAKQLLQKLASL